MLKPIMDARDASAMYSIKDSAKLAAYCRSVATRFATVDGFCGAGKSTLATDLAEQLNWPLISFDDFLPDDSMNVQSYVARLDWDRLARTIRGQANAVLEGAFMREVVQGTVVRAEMTTVYVALCSHPMPERVIWHDGMRIEDGDGPAADWLTELETDYHRRWRPHEDADAICLRRE